MSDKERFEALKKEMVEENEKQYGAEIREKYGEEEVTAYNQKMLNMTEEQFQRYQRLETEIRTRLEQAVLKGASPESKEVQEIVALHKEWLMMTWKKYTKEAHTGVGKMYVADERFKKYYDKEMAGCAKLLAAAIEVFCQA